MEGHAKYKGLCVSYHWGVHRSENARKRDKLHPGQQSGSMACCWLEQERTNWEGCLLRWAEDENFWGTLRWGPPPTKHKRYSARPFLGENKVCFPSTPCTVQIMGSHLRREVGLPVNCCTATIKYSSTLQTSRPGVPPLKENKIKSSNQLWAHYHRQWLTQASLPKQKAWTSIRISIIVTPVWQRSKTRSLHYSSSNWNQLGVMWKLWEGQSQSVLTACLKQRPQLGPKLIDTKKCVC